MCVCVYVCTWASMCECRSRWTPWLQILPHLIWRGSGGAAAAAPGNHAGKLPANYTNERSRRPDVCVLACVHTVFWVCRSNKYEGLFGPHEVQRSHLGQRHITQIWETASFSTGCVIEFHIAAGNRTFRSFSVAIICVWERGNQSERFRLWRASDTSRRQTRCLSLGAGIPDNVDGA